MGLDYACEKFGVAVDRMARSTESLQDRLAEAYLEFHTVSLGLTGPDPDIPDDLRADFDAIHHALTKVSAKGDEGSLNATIREMSDKEAREVIGRIVMFYGDLEARRGPMDLEP